MRINLFTPQSVSQLANSAANSVTTVLSTSLKPGQTAKDAMVNLSIEGVTRSRAASAFSQFFPTREGFSSDALALSTALPQSTSSSTGLVGAEVGQDARNRLDATYAAMEASGAAYGRAGMGINDVYTLFGSLDRRSLLAVAQNEDGLFSSDEQASAQGLMDQQRALASGQYSGPVSLMYNYKTVDDQDVVQTLAASFLDNVSDEEKATSAWQVQRAQLLRVAPLKVQDTLNDTLARLMVAVGKQ
ncbi:hypothetical protein [Pseudomonas putida]